jgi:hypothetical protein
LSTYNSQHNNNNNVLAMTMPYSVSNIII